MISERCLGYDGRHDGSGEVGGRGGKSVPSWELEGKEGGALIRVWPWMWLVYWSVYVYSCDNMMVLA